MKFNKNVDNPELSGFLKKPYQKDFIQKTLNGKSYIKFQLSTKNDDGTYTNYDCESWNLYIVGKIEEWEKCLIRMTDYTIKTREYNDKIYTTYVVSTFNTVEDLNKKKETDLPPLPPQFN